MKKPIKIRLYNDGGYGEAGSVKFPVDVMGYTANGAFYKVLGLELINVGFSEKAIAESVLYWFSANRECKPVIKCELPEKTS